MILVLLSYEVTATDAVTSPLVAVTSPSDFASASSKKFLDIQATIECGFTLKRVRDMTRRHSLLSYLTLLLVDDTEHVINKNWAVR